MSVNPELRRQVIAMYKGAIPCFPRLCLSSRWQRSALFISACCLLFMGREYPLGFAYFRPRLHKAFAANAGLRDEAAIRRGLERAEFVKKEIEAL
ncbi:NADH-ubiquinone oxidoreductase complex 1/LYR family protein [Verticillium dahliae VdLs.17]|uniref:NADH-ubiquinone oxidoreductase complex 1/LYR family protein n=1 Tax=Verticillium dahliae (strain VdLs.17 / ATCC MYA-4575 / FGSC 10137) TaxID=498257 RepID=G2X3W0_VERDV|nr:NADH-ubiquinone oxidoreductase complex 1/LYR family protein [Verticillium dahliae VdLs.17]EGY23259.1 NADH-ubiquinone oxidoreductase complex 1/LYR family protein [Verticillium dahliae VdLs.17]